MTTDALASIDGALAAYGTVDYGDTGDSMRWRPEAPQLVICDAGRPLRLDSRAMPPAATETGRPAECQATPTADTDEFTAEMDEFTAEMAKVTLAIHDLHAVMDPRWHRRQCAACNPRGRAGKLAVDGREYQRRLRNRRRRR